MGVGIDFWLQLAVLLACLFFAAPRGGMTLGMMGGIGLVVFVFGFGLTPGKPPVDVILTIMAVVCAGSALQAAGGLDCLLQIAEKLLLRCSLHLLVPDGAVRNGARRLHDASDYL